VHDPDAEHDLRAALREAATGMPVDVSAAEVLRRARGRPGLREIAVAVAVAAVILASGIGIVGYLNLPTTGTTSGPPTPLPVTPAPTPTSTLDNPTTQEQLFSAIGEWLATYDRTGGPLQGPVYVQIGLGNNASDSWFDPVRVPELGQAGPPVPGDELTEASRNALSESIAPIGRLSFISDPDSVRNPDAAENAGCRPYLGYHAMLRFSRPRPTSVDRSSFLVAVNIDLGCQGPFQLLELKADVYGYHVVRVVSDGSWIA
jgi:hypothetical protein